MELLVTFDVRNAFNFVRWEEILDTQQDIFQVPRYLLRILGDYLKNRSLLNETLEGQRRKGMTSGEEQGFFLEPYLWNASYDSLIRLYVQEESYLVGFAVDGAVLIARRTVEQAESRLGMVS